jgi:hypothetical protein
MDMTGTANDNPCFTLHGAIIMSMERAFNSWFCIVFGRFRDFGTGIKAIIVQPGRLPLSGCKALSVKYGARFEFFGVEMGDGFAIIFC